jgi:hypothetical protein
MELLFLALSVKSILLVNNSWEVPSSPACHPTKAGVDDLMSVFPLWIILARN